jgi:hypothetical protein
MAATAGSGQSRGETSLCLCSTHLQLVNIVEYLAYRRVENNHLIVLESGSADRGIVDFARQHYTTYFTSITEVKRWAPKNKLNPLRKLGHGLRFRRQIKSAIDAIGVPVDQGVFGHGAEVYMGTAYKYAGRPPVVIVDDGTDTYRYLTDQRFRSRQRKKSRRQLKRYLYDSDCGFLDIAQFFTLLDPARAPENLDVIQNPYTVLKQALGDRPLKQEQHIVGQHLVEIEAMDAVDYRKQIAALCADFDGPSRYFPHPGEIAENLESLAGIPGLDIVNINQPYELYFLNQPESPCQLSSFCTTAFITLSSWVNDPRIRFYYLDIVPLLKRQAIVERAKFAYSFTRNNPQLELIPAK